MSKRHDFGRLSRPGKFSALNSIRLLRCYTIIKRQRLPSSLYSCIQRVTSFVSLNNHLGTLIHAHGCFRFDCPPYHEQSEYLLSIYVIPRLISNGRVATPPNLTCAITQSMEFIVLYLHKSKKKNNRKCHSKKCFVEYQLSRGQNGLSKLILNFH